MIFDLLVTGLAIGALYGLIALSITIIYAGLDIVHFAQGEIITLGAFIGLVLLERLRLPFPLAFAGSVFLVVALSVGLQRLVYNPILKGGGGFSVRGLTFVVAGFGVSILLQNLYWIVWSPMPRPFNVDFGRPIAIGSMRLQAVYGFILFMSMALMGLLALFFKRTRLGLAVRAISYNKSVASLMGINVGLMMSVTFGLAAALTSAAGILMAPITFVQYNLGSLILQKAFCAAVIGGFGNVFGAIAGGLILGVVENVGAGLISSGYKDMISFVIMILVLMFKPNGLFSHRVKQKA